MASYEELDKTFNITPIEPEVSSVEIVKSEDEPTSEKVNADFEYSRSQLYNLIEKGQKAINGIMDVAQQSDHPRAYEVAFQGIKNVSELAEKLIDLQKKLKDIEEESGTRGPSTVNNSVFIGSTAELQKFLKQSKLNNTEE
jgi:hypothetical protein